MAKRTKSFIKPNRPLLIIAVLYLLIIFLLCSIFFISLDIGVPLERFTRDPSATTGTDPLVGLVSNIGILFWCTGASICLYSFFNIIYSRGKKINDRPLFLLVFGAITAILMLDDLFLFHESIAPRVFNIPENSVYVFYGLIVLFSIIRFRRTILQTNWIILSLAFTFFALSIANDLFKGLFILPSSTFIEDSFKLLGIVSWVYYFILSSVQIEKMYRR